MKLRYDIAGKKELKFRMFVIGIFFEITTLLIIFQTVLIMTTSFSTPLFVNIAIYTIIIGLGIIAFLFGVKNFRKKDNNKEELKNIGTKVSANIINVCTIEKRTGRHSKIDVNCLDVTYDNDEKKSRIEFIEDNAAYRLLKMLLNPYPIKKEIRIPIDIYVYNDDVYADLESVNFTHVEGYEECKKAIDKIYNTN